MAILKVADLGTPILTKRANPIQVTQIKNKGVQKIVDDMIETLKSQKAAGVAAPQVGELKRIIVLHYKPRKDSLRHIPIPLTIIINPIVLEKSEDKELDWESCLSVNGGDIRGLVPRYKTIEVQGFDRLGKKTVFKYTGFKARMLQHEMDHLEGRLFFERMRKTDFTSLSTRSVWLAHHKKKWKKPASL